MRRVASRTLAVVSPHTGPIKRRPDGPCFPQQKDNRLLDCEQISLIAAYYAIDSRSGKGRMAAGLWQVGLWQKAAKLRIRMDSSAVSFQLSYSSSLVAPGLTLSTF